MLDKFAMWFAMWLLTTISGRVTKFYILVPRLVGTFENVKMLTVLAQKLILVRFGTFNIFWHFTIIQSLNGATVKQGRIDESRPNIIIIIIISFPLS